MDYYVNDTKINDEEAFEWFAETFTTNAAATTNNFLHTRRWLGCEKVSKCSGQFKLLCYVADVQKKQTSVLTHTPYSH